MKSIQARAIAGVVSVCMFLCIFCACSTGKSAIALKVGSRKISVLDFQIYYHIYVSNFYTQFADTYSQMDIDPTVSYNDQKCYFDSSKTWAEFFVENTVEYCQELMSFLIRAKDDGISLTAEEEKTVEDKFLNLSSTLKDKGMDETEYIGSLYGEGAEVNDVIRILKNIALYSKEYEYVATSFGYTQTDYDEYYKKHVTDIDTVTVRMIPFVYSDGVMTKDEAKAAADAFNIATPDETTLTDKQTDVLSSVQKKYYEGTDYSITYNVGRNYFSDSKLNTWLFSSERTYWDSYICDLNGMYAVIKFIEKDTKDYKMVNIRHILVADTTSDGATQIGKIYEQWSSSTYDETSFADYSVTYSEDNDTSVNGGLIPNVYKGKLANELTKWCFDKEHNYADSDIVFTEYGYHMVLFLSYGENYRTYLCRTAMESAAYDILYSKMKSEYLLKINKGYVYSVVE